MTAPKIVTPDQYKPKVVSYPTLRKTLIKYTVGFKWGEDAIYDLWKMGAPAPQAAVCPLEPPCSTSECTHVKRILLPNQFKKWWGEVQARMGHQLGAHIPYGKV